MDTTLGSTTLVLGVDQSDEHLSAYLDVQAEKIIHPGHPTMIEKLNSMAARMVARHADHPYLGFMGDDHLPRTVGWDERVMEALDSLPGPGIVWCNDLFQRENLPTAVFLHSEIVECLGWMALPTLRHLYCDNVWLHLAHQLGHRYLDDVIIEHIHPHAGKTAADEQYDRVNSAEMYALDEAAYLAWRRDHSIADVEKVQKRCRPLE